MLFLANKKSVPRTKEHEGKGGRRKRKEEDGRGRKGKEGEGRKKEEGITKSEGGCQTKEKTGAWKLEVVCFLETVGGTVWDLRIPY